MKRKIIYVLAVLFIGITSCEKKLELNPTQSIDEQSALSSSSAVLNALNGAYANLGSTAFYGGEVLLYSELLGDAGDIRFTGTFQGLTQIFNKAIPKNNVFVRDNWLQGYRVINDVNNVLSAINKVDALAKDRAEGESKFIRGSVYFELVRLYSKAWNDGNPATNLGVPIVLTPTRGIVSENFVARNKVSEVYDQVIKDLTEAEAKLPVSNGNYATKNAAAAMLARVYLQKGDYANAAQAANRVIGSGSYSLASTFAGVFPSTPAITVEDIFAMQVSPTQGANGLFTYFSPDSRGDISINSTHLALYETGDARRAFFVTSGGSPFTSKHNTRFANVRIIRLAEMYLIRAESNFRLGTTTGDSPLNDINRIRTRAGLPALTAANLNLNSILKERKLELAFEGHLLHDIKRLQGTVGLLPWNSCKLVLPIPERERIVNPNLLDECYP